LFTIPILARHWPDGATCLLRLPILIMDTRSQTYIARRKPLELRADRVNEQKVVNTWEGPRTAYPGDYVMIGVKGEQWPVPGLQFDELYEIMGLAQPGGTQLKVRKRIMELPVYQTYRPFTYEVRGEQFKVEPGYFIVSYSEEDRFPCEPEVFFQTFDIIRTANEEEKFDIPIC